MVAFEASLLRSGGDLVVLAAFFGLLLAISVIDWRTRRIPNALVGALIVLRLVALGVDVVFGHSGAAIGVFAGSFVVALCFVVVLLTLKGLMERVLHKDCMGLGDVKLLGAGCLFLDFEQAFSALMLAAILGIVIALYYRLVCGDRTFPFGPALCCGLFGALFL